MVMPLLGLKVTAKPDNETAKPDCVPTWAKPDCAPIDATQFGFCIR